MMFPSRLSAQHGEDVVLVQEHVLDAVELDLGPRVLPEEDAVAHLHVERTNLAVLLHLAVADGDDQPLDRLLLGRVGDDDAPLALQFLLYALDHEAVGQGTDLHGGLILRGTMRRFSLEGRAAFGTRLVRAPAARKVSPSRVRSRAAGERPVEKGRPRASPSRRRLALALRSPRFA